MLDDDTHDKVLKELQSIKTCCQWFYPIDEVHVLLLHVNAALNLLEHPSDRTYEQSRGHPTAPRERHPRG